MSKRYHESSSSHASPSNKRRPKPTTDQSTGSTVTGADLDPFDESNFVEKKVDLAQAKVEADGWSHILGKATTRERKQRELMPDPSSLGPSAREYNKEMPIKTVSSDTVTYEFGDRGSDWRMMKLRSLRDKARETNRSIEDIAFERYGTLEKYDQAREEEQELSRRKTYGIQKTKPDGSLYRKRMERLHASDVQQVKHDEQVKEEIKADAMSHDGQILSIGDLNALKARLLKAQIMRSADEHHLQLEYNAALKRYDQSLKTDKVVVLPEMDTRAEPLTKDENDMTIEELLREEKRESKHHRQSHRDADNIVSDKKFNDSLDYADENADKLAKRIQKKTINLKNTQINDFQRINKILDNCPLCHKQDGEEPPIAPVISLATRTFLSLPSSPLTQYHCLIVPTEHRFNTLQCDDDEHQEIRNFMKSITRFYDTLACSPIFYENNARPRKKGHCAIECIPIPKRIYDLVPRYFQESISSSDEEWATHRPIIDTTNNHFTKKMTSELPYFHVWFDLNGGMGHVIENAEKWPKDDLFGREVVASILNLPLEKWRRKGRWDGDGNSVEEREFKKVWDRWDWTKALIVE